MRVLVTGAGGFIGRNLVRTLLAQGAIAGPGGAPARLDELVLADRAPFDAPDTQGPRVTAMVGDLTEDALLKSVLDRPPDSIFHLAATLTVEAERDLDGGWAANLHLPFRLLEACRHAGHRPRFVYASSIAVFGGDLPGQISDHHVQQPQTSYGTAKSVSELLINDYSRHGFVDGRAMRLPIVVVQPGEPVPAVSDRIAALIREPLRGRDAICPVDRATRFPIASVRRIAGNLLRVHDAPASAFGDSRAVNQPGLSVTPDDIVAALAGVAGRETANRIRFEPDPAIERAVASWPSEFVTGIDLAPPLEPDPDLESIVKDYLADRDGIDAGGRPQPALE